MCLWIADLLVMNGAYPQNTMTKLAENKIEHVPTYDELERKAWMALILITLVGFTQFFTVVCDVNCSTYSSHIICIWYVTEQCTIIVMSLVMTIVMKFSIY